MQSLYHRSVAAPNDSVWIAAVPVAHIGLGFRSKTVVLFTCAHHRCSLFSCLLPHKPPPPPGPPRLHDIRRDVFSHIRETMMRLMVPSAPRQQSSTGDVHGVHEHFDAIDRGDFFCDSLGERHISEGPSACVFWCAVAMGALVKGSSLESVRRPSV